MNDIGKITVLPKGEYRQDRVYYPLDLVYVPDDKTAYISLTQNKEKAPVSNSEDWMNFINLDTIVSKVIDNNSLIINENGVISINTNYDWTVNSHD